MVTFRRAAARSSLLRTVTRFSPSKVTKPTSPGAKSASTASYSALRCARSLSALDSSTARSVSLSFRPCTAVPLSRKPTRSLMRVYTLCAGNPNVCTKTLLDSRTNEWYTSPMKYKDRAMRADATVQRDALAFLETHGRARPVDVHRALPQYSAPLIVATLAALA